MRRIYWRGVSAAGACLMLALLNCSTDALAQTQDDLAALETKIDELYRAGSYDEALPLAERLVAGRTAKFGDLSAEHAEALNWLASLYFSQSRFDKAEPIYQRVLTIREIVLGAGHEDVHSTLGMLASVYLSTGRPNLAEPLLKRVLSQREQATTPDRGQIVYSLKQLASAASALNHYDEAEAHIRRALAMVEGADQDPAETAALFGALAEVQRGQGKLADASTSLERALSLHEKAAQSQDQRFVGSSEPHSGLGSDGQAVSSDGSLRHSSRIDRARARPDGKGTRARSSGRCIGT